MGILKTNILTQREYEVLELIVQGNNNPEIAKKLCISTHTVKTHVESIYYKFSAHNKIQAVVYAIKNGLL